jgi:hypothetical protein
VLNFIIISQAALLMLTFQIAHQDTMKRLSNKGEGKKMRALISEALLCCGILLDWCV